MPLGTVSFTAFAGSGFGVGAQTTAQKAAAVPRAGLLGIQTSGGTTIEHLAADTAAGMTLAELDLGWDSASTGDNTFSSGYLSDAANVVGQLQSAGYQVAVSAGIFNYPSWLNGYANWQYVDQGSNGSGSPNFAFNPTVRSKAAAYISALQAAMASAGVTPDYYRVGVAPDGEMYLPDSLPITSGTGSWWAFDALAQASGGTGLPAGVGACPMRGWTPGQSTWEGSPVTVAMATSWWDWYMGAVNNAHQWEIAAHQATGWGGCLMLVIPGQGESPALLNNRLGNLLGPSTIFPTDFEANIAAYWPSTIAACANPANTVVDISSVGDGSGNSTGGGVNNASEAGDQSVPLTGGSGSADPYYSGWSSVRWIAYLAGQHGVLTLGESVGGDGTASNVAPVMTQARGCGLYALMWANDISMAAGGSNATPAEVVAGFKAAWP
jgi:hypothetical protein